MEALVKSMNIPTVHLADQVGIEKIIRTAKNVGISTLVTDGEYSDTNLAASLGGLTYGVSVWDMAKAYSVFANGGKMDIDERAGRSHLPRNWRKCVYRTAVSGQDGDY